MEKNCAVQIAVRERGGPLDQENRIISYYDQNEHIISVDERAFSFDYVVGPQVTQKELFEKLIRPLIVKVRQGYNCTALAYGQTGAGKTYTIGLDTTTFDGEEAGMIPRTLTELFGDDAQSEATALRAQIEVHVSFVEIYNEKVFDLLGTDATEQILPKGWKNYSGTLKKVTTIEDCKAILLEGSKMRHVRPTILNSQSSRSHAIFSIHYTQRTHAKTVTSYFNLVDLAGSEGLRRTGNEGMAKAEGVNINQGLLGIGKVLQAMAAGSKVVPYRDSVLSLVLQDSLSPNSYLTLVACISPYRENLHATLSTLRFAQNAKLVKHTPQMNAVLNEIRRSKIHMASSTKKLKRLALFEPRSDAKRAGLQHGNTFCTPNKRKTMTANKLSQSGIGLTPRAKQKARQKLALAAHQQRSVLRPSTNLRFEAGLNQSSESMSSTLMSFNISSSTQVDANEAPPLLPAATNQNFSPVIRKYMLELEQRMESKLQSLTDVLINRIGNNPTANFTTNTIRQTPNERTVTTQLIHQHNDFVQKIVSKTIEELAEAPLPPEVTSSTEIQPKQLFVTSSPIFKQPQIPTAFAKRNRTNLVAANTANDFSSVGGEDVNHYEEHNNTVMTRHRSRVLRKSTFTNSSMELSGIEETSVQPDFASRSKRRQSTRLMLKRDASTSQPEQDSAVVALPTRKQIEKRKSTAANLLTLGKGTSQLAKYRKQLLDLFNKGTIQELTKLPQIGKKTAYQLVLQRTLHGKLKSLHEVEKLPIWRGSAWQRFAEANCL